MRLAKNAASVSGGARELCDPCGSGRGMSRGSRSRTRGPVSRVVRIVCSVLGSVDAPPTQVVAQNDV